MLLLSFVDFGLLRHTLNALSVTFVTSGSFATALAVRYTSM